jgi:hypothetical protein
MKLHLATGATVVALALGWFASIAYHATVGRAAAARTKSRATAGEAVFSSGAETVPVEQRRIEALGRADLLYGAWRARARLDGNTWTAVKVLLAERQLAAEEIALAMIRTIGPKHDAQQSQQRMLSDNKAIYSARLRSHLTTDQFASLGAFESTLPQRAAIGLLEQRLRYSGSPLTEEQTERAIARLAAVEGERTPLFVAPGTIVAGFSAAAVHRVEIELDDEQRAVLHSIYAEQQARLARTPSRRTAMTQSATTTLESIDLEHP